MSETDAAEAPPKRRRTTLVLGLSPIEKKAVEVAAGDAHMTTHAWARDVLRLAVGMERLTPGRLGVRLRRD